jgi:speckle-type POZ protein
MEPSTAEMSMPIDAATANNAHLTNASQTEIRVEYIKHNWTVKNFSHCYQEYLENFVHLPRGEDTLTWSIKIYPKGNGENNKDFVFLCLNRVINNNAKSNKIGFRSRFFLKNSEGKDIEMRIHPNPSHSDYVSYIKRDVLFPQISPADSIVVFVEIDVAVETVTTQLDDNGLGFKSCSCEGALGDDYLKILNDDLLTDFTIKVEGKEIRVHKAILAARSPVFAAMFNHEDTDEVKTGVLCIEDVEYSVLREMLNFIYAGRCTPDITDLASDLLIAADKYRLEELKNHCERCLMQALAHDNACQLLIISDVYNAERLRQKAVRFILHHTKDITSTPGWDQLLNSHPKLVTDIVRNFDKTTGGSSSVTEPGPSSSFTTAHFSH